MKKDSQAKKIVNQIKEEDIKPKSKWELNRRSYLLWVIWALLIVLGSMFFSLILLNLTDLSADFLKFMTPGRFAFVMLHTAPYLWIGLLFLAMLIGYVTFRKTKRGYRYNAWLIISLVILFACLLGLAIHWSKANSGLEKGFLKKFPEHRRMLMMRESRLEMPEEGVLGGILISKKGEEMILESFKGSQWGIITTKQTRIKQADILDEGTRIIIFGQKINDDTFEASMIKIMKRPRDEAMKDWNNLPKGAGKFREFEHRNHL